METLVASVKQVGESAVACDVQGVQSHGHQAMQAMKELEDKRSTFEGTTDHSQQQLKQLCERLRGTTEKLVLLAKQACKSEAGDAVTKCVQEFLNAVGEFQDTLKSLEEQRRRRTTVTSPQDKPTQDAAEDSPDTPDDQ